MQSTFNSEISQAVEPMLAFFVSNFNIHKISFPLLPNTYTLWRTSAYQAMQNLPYYKASPQAATYEFYLISQTVLLHNFADRLLQQIQSTQPKDTFGSYSQEYKIGNQLIQKYNKALEIHSLYAELFEDITKLPYLADAFPPARKYKLAETYAPKIVAHSQKEEVGQKFSSGLLNKGIGFITEKLFTKTFLLQASSIAVKLNPIAMIASFAFAQLIEKLKKEKKGLQISQKILETLLDIQQKVQNLKNAYQQCIGLLGPALKAGGQSRGKVISAIKQIMIEDWLQIQTIKDDDGWQVVILNNLETPQTHKQTQ